MMIAPFEGGRFRLTSPIGYRSIPSLSMYNTPHYGIDLVGISSKTVLCVKAGTVIRSRIVTNKSDPTSEWGNYVCVQSPDGTMIYYCHLSSRAVSEGQKVNVGSVIGVEGATGKVTGSHLHIEARIGSKKCGIPAREDDPANISTIIGCDNKLGTYQADDDIGDIISSCGIMEKLWRPRMTEFCRKYEYGDEFWRRIAKKCRK